MARCGFAFLAFTAARAVAKEDAMIPSFITNLADSLPHTDCSLYDTKTDVTCAWQSCPEAGFSTCTEGICSCQFGTCAVGKECVANDNCPRDTGGVCTYLDCDSSRNAYCVEESSLTNHASRCICREDQCSVDGVCVDKPTGFADHKEAAPAPPPPQDGLAPGVTGLPYVDCTTPPYRGVHIGVTGAQCGSGDCPKSSNGATCESSMCKCDAGSCSVNEECVKDGDCPRDTGGTCSLGDCHSWRNADCLAEDDSSLTSKCFCKPDECAVGGRCVDKMEFLEPSELLVQLMDGTISGEQYSARRSWIVDDSSLAWTWAFPAAFFVGTITVGLKMQRARQIEIEESYEPLIA